jgi:CSLREA domain-containing protein
MNIPPLRSRATVVRLSCVRERSLRGLGSLVLLLALAIGVSGGNLAYGATTISVNTTSDEVVTDGQCSLREAINNANGNTDTSGGDCAAGSVGADTIDLSSLSGTITLVPLFLGGLGGLPNINDDVTIDGPGANKLTVNADGNDRVFFNEANTTIAGVTATGAIASCGDTFGGGIVNWGSGSLTLENSAVNGNTNCFHGGGIVTALFGGSAPVTIIDSTVSNNSGDGIFNSCCVHLSITNSTIAGNSDSIGGGILNNGTLTVVNSTVAGNSSTAIGVCCTGGGILNNGVAAFQNTIVAQNSPDNCFSDGSLTDAGYNLSNNGASCGFGASTSNPNAGPMFDPAGLTDNGGPTPTIALLTGSPAVDAIPPGVNDCGTTITTDQRGVARPQGPGCDIGAFEVAQSTPAQLLAALGSAVTGVGPGTSLADKVAQALAYLNSGDVSDACSTLTAFISEVKAQSGRTIPQAQAATLIASAQQIETLLGC